MDHDSNPGESQYRPTQEEKGKRKLSVSDHEARPLPATGSKDPRTKGLDSNSTPWPDDSQDEPNRSWSGSLHQMPNCESSQNPPAFVGSWAEELELCEPQGDPGDFYGDFYKFDSDVQQSHDHKGQPMEMGAPSGLIAIAQPPADSARLDFGYDSHSEAMLDSDVLTFFGMRNDKVDYLGQLQGGRKYACPTRQTFAPISYDHYMQPKDCAHHLGYRNIGEFMKDYSPDNVIGPLLRDWDGFHHERNEDYGEISALSVFQRFGHRIVYRGRPVFDDPPEFEANKAGLRDNTLWAAAQGAMSLPCLIELLEQTEELDFNSLDSTSTIPLNYMNLKQINNMNDTGSFSLDPVSILLWQRALSSSSQEDAEQALRDITDGFIEKSTGDPGCIRGADLKVLESSLDFCSAIRALDEHQCRSFQGILEKGVVSEDISNNQVLFCQWEVPHLLQTLVSRSNQTTIQEVIDGLITVAGSSDAYDCCDCSSFARKYWGSSGRTAVALICTVVEKLLDVKAEETIEGTMTVLGSQHIDISYAATRSYFALSLPTTVSHMRETPPLRNLFDALSWICCAIRPVEASSPSNRRLRSSKLCKELLIKRRPPSELSFAKRNFVFVKLQPLAEDLVEPLWPCWTHLFFSVPVVEIEIVRTWGRGLEIPFELMVELSAVENVCTFDGRTALLGYFTALIPTDEDENWDRIQWHLEVVEASTETLLPSTLQQRLQGKRWIKIDPQEMHKKTCFLGWSSNANVMLGTKALVERQGMLRSPINMEFARSHLERDTVEAGFQISLGIPGIEPILKGSKAWKRQDNTVTRSPVSDYRLSLNLARRKTSLLVDSQSKQAWLVPVLSVVFHLCHLFYRMNKIGDEETPIPFAEPSCDGDLAVLKAISDCHDLQVLGSRFSALFHQQYCNLVDHPRRTTSNFFYANDLMHSLENKRTFPRKVPLRGDGFSWPDLLPFATGADAIAVGANIGQILQPVSSADERLCLCDNLSCDRLPIGRCYLAAHVPSLQHLCDLDGIMSAQRCQFMLSETSWIVRGDPWSLAQCNGSSIWDSAAMMCGLLQETRPDKVKWWEEVKIGHSRKVMPLLKEIPSSGVVVFGRRSIK